MDPQSQKQLQEQFDIRDRTLKLEFRSLHDRIDDLVNENEARDKGIRREFRNVYEGIDAGFS